MEQHGARMRANYLPATLSAEERIMLNILLEVECDIQSWRVFACSRLLLEEIPLCTQ
jgi:hypothetical protein